MLYGEYLSADEVPIKCACGVTATVEVTDARGCSLGWFCRRCAERARNRLRRQTSAIATAVARKVSRFSLGDLPSEASPIEHAPLLGRGPMIVGCSCGWRTPPGTTNSDEAHSAHVAAAQVRR